MSFKEIAEAKKCALTTSDWDAYQVIIRTCLKNLNKEQLPHPEITLPAHPQQTAAVEQRPAVN